MDGSCAREIEHREAASAIAKKIAKGSIIAKATERLIYQIVEVCAERERESVEAAIEACAKIADRMPDDAKAVASAIRATIGGTAKWSEPNILDFESDADILWAEICEYGESTIIERIGAAIAAAYAAGKSSSVDKGESHADD